MVKTVVCTSTRNYYLTNIEYKSIITKALPHSTRNKFNTLSLCCLYKKTVQEKTSTKESALKLQEKTSTKESALSLCCLYKKTVISSFKKKHPPKNQHSASVACTKKPVISSFKKKHPPKNHKAPTDPITDAVKKDLPKRAVRWYSLGR